MEPEKFIKYLTARETASMLALNIADVNALINSGDLCTSITDEGVVCFNLKDVLDYAEKNRIHVQDADASRYRVLIVDDEESFASMLKAILETMPYNFDVDIANNGFQAGYKARQYTPDLILLDFMMPSVTGIEVIEALKSEPETKHIRVIGLTGNATDNTANRMVRLGAEQVLRKPFTPEQLANALKLNEFDQFSRLNNAALA